MFKRKIFAKCIHTIYWSNNYISFEERIEDPILINIERVDYITKQEYEHKLFGEAQGVSYLVMFGQPKSQKHFPVIVFESKEERDKYYNQIYKRYKF